MERADLAAEPGQPAVWPVVAVREAQLLLVACSRQPWRRLARHARQAVEEAVRLARHEPPAGCFAAVRLEDSEARPATPVEAFAGLVPPASHSAPATACHSRQAWRRLARHGRQAVEEAAVRLARHEPQAGCFAAVRLEEPEARPATPVEAFVGLAPRAFRLAPATACHLRQAWRRLARHGRQAVEEAAVRLARHEPRPGCFAAARLEGSEARPATPVEAFVGLAPRAFRLDPATSCHSRQARPGREANQLPAKLRAGRGFSPELPDCCLQSMSPFWPRMAAGRHSRRSPPPRQLQHLRSFADPALGEGYPD